MRWQNYIKLALAIFLYWEDIHLYYGIIKHHWMIAHGH